MTTASSISVGLAHKMCQAATEAGWSPSDINALAQDKITLSRFLDVRRGIAKIEYPKLSIDCDTDCMPHQWKSEGWKVWEKYQLPNRIQGKIELDLSKIRLWVSREQQAGKNPTGCALAKELTDQPVLSDNVLEALLRHPEHIPEKWKKDENGETLHIYFWGRIYQEPNYGGLHVRFLFFSDDRWQEGHGFLFCTWNAKSLACLLTT